MPPCVALLRAVNLPSHGKVSMADLQRVCVEAGLRDARTLLQTGNVVFDSREQASDVERRIEHELARQLRLTTDVMVRTRASLDRVIRDNPLPAQATKDPSHLVVVFLKSAVKAQALAALEARIPGREQVRAQGPHLYIYYPDGIGASRLTGAAIDRVIGTPGTGRNWNTLSRIRTAMDQL